MNKFILILEKAIVTVLIILIFIDSLYGVEIPRIAYYIPLFSIAAMRSFIISLVLIMNLTSITNAGIKRIFKKRSRIH
jgi:hypothetical protein